MKSWLVLAALYGCGNAGVVGPAVATAAAVAEVAVYRATQRGCWGQCGNGAQCNEKNGLCEAIPCGGKCTGDWVCQVTSVGEECVPPSLLVRPPTGTVTPASGCTPVPDAGSLLIVNCSDAGAD